MAGLILGPLVYIVGLVASIRWLMRGGKSERQKLGEDLQKMANAEPYGERQHVLAEIALLLQGSKPVNSQNISRAPVTPAVAYASNETEPAASQPAATSHTMFSGTVESSAQLPTASVSVSTGMSRDVTDVFKTMDNINVLLYLGAFLIVASVGIFVGFNFTSIGGVTKTALVAVLALLFYGAGIALYIGVPRLRPAGSTFTAIGLVVAPLVGLAYYNFVLSATGDAGLVWLVTSCISLVLYIVSFAVMKQQYMAYFGAISSLSLVESLIQSAHLPVYYLAWGLVVSSTLLALVSYIRSGSKRLSVPLQRTSAVSAPLSAVVSLVFIGEHGIGQLGITALLASFYYLAMSIMSRAMDQVLLYYALGLMLIPTGLAFVLQGASQSSFMIAMVLLGVGAVYCATGMVIKQRWADMRPAITSLLGGVALLAAAMLVIDVPSQLSLTLAVAACINIFVGLAGKYSYNLMLGILAMLYLPIAVLLQWMDPSQPHSLVSVAYLVLAAAIVGMRAITRSWEPDFRLVTRFGYIAALALAFGFAILAGPSTILVIGLIISAAAYGIGYLEGREEINLVAGALMYIAVAQLVAIFNLDQSSYAYIFTIAGTVVYGLGLADRRGGSAMRLTGLVGPFMGALMGGIADQHNLSSILGLLVGGMLLLAEGRRQSSSSFVEAAAAVYVLALAKLLWAAGVTSTPVYADLAGAYFAWLAYRRYRQGLSSGRDTMTVLALAAITIPTGVSSLSEGGQLDGLILTIESIAMVLAGMALKLRLVRQWGVYVLVGEVVYQSRTLISALPWYVITALLGAALLAGAIWLLSRRNNDTTTQI